MAPLRPLPRKRVRYATSNVSTLPEGSRIAEIMTYKPLDPTVRSNVEPKILHHTYAADLRRADALLGIHPDFTESVIKRVEVIPYVHTAAARKVDGVDLLSKVSTKFKMKKGKVEVEITCPIENLYTSFYSKGVKPPLKDRILAYERIGYTNQQLAKMIKNDDDFKKKAVENDKFIETIFGDPSKKKTSAPVKKKTLLQIIGYKKPKYATNDDFNEAEAEEE
ncbi:hypothetical protein N9095_00120 [bacterium]|nr:hypothetical protein [bacterium]